MERGSRNHVCHATPPPAAPDSAPVHDDARGERRGGERGHDGVCCAGSVRDQHHAAAVTHQVQQRSVFVEGCTRDPTAARLVAAAGEEHQRGLLAQRAAVDDEHATVGPDKDVARPPV